MFLAFSTEAEYTIREIYENMDSDERAEMFQLLKRDKKVYVNNYNPEDEIFNFALEKLMNNRHKLTLDQERMIISLAGRL